MTVDHNIPFSDGQQGAATSFLSNNLRFLRQRLELSQQDLADRLGLNRGNIASYENGSAEPKIYNLLKISKFFCVHILDLTEQDLSEEQAYTKASSRFANLSHTDREVLESFAKQAEEVERFLESIYHCCQYTVNGLPEPGKEVQIMMTYVDQIHNAALQVLRQHQQLLGLIKCRLQ